MSETTTFKRPRLRRSTVLWMLAALTTAALATRFPADALETAEFVVYGLWCVAPLVIPGILISAWVSASGASQWIRRSFDGNVMSTVLVASAIGAITPVCGVTVLPLMTGLLASGVPLAPVMAFWLSSPVTDPAMFATTAATLGVGFAVGKSVAAFGIGLLGGAATAALGRSTWVVGPLRNSGFVTDISCSSACGSPDFNPRVWDDVASRRRFRREVWGMTRLILLCLVPAFAAEHMLHRFLEPTALAAYVGEDRWWAIPVSVFVGAPAYLDGYAALPLTRGLMDHGMSAGAAMAFLVSGSVVSIWGALAIVPVLRVKPFTLYLLLAVVGSLAAGWLYGAVA